MARHVSCSGGCANGSQQVEKSLFLNEHSVTCTVVYVHVDFIVLF